MRFSAEDTCDKGFTVIVAEDACRGIDVEGSIAATKVRLAALGIASATTETISREAPRGAPIFA